jgi:FtsP/CotA-like multicopper oxidase with cupredoxin domain
VRGLSQSWAAAALLVACACTPPSARRAERITPNDNRHPAGALRDSTLTVDLELRRGRWYPEADDGPSVEVLAFAEGGRHPLQIPAPLIRVREGTRVRVRLRNTLTDSTLVVRGLPDSLAVPPGATREVAFTARAPGTYYYWATTSGRSIDERDGDDSQLSGAFIVDPPEGATSDRLFVLGVWSRAADAKEVMTINGRSWPHTERLDVPLGDTVSWRWMNPTASSHPMHLHGFYFRVDSRGDWMRDTVYADSMRQLEVTELMLPGGTMAMRWAPTRPGNWLFHCHFAFHVSREPTLTGPAATDDHTAERAMAGLVLGIRTPPGQRATPARAGAPRDLRLLVQSRPGYFDTATGYGFVLQSGPAEPARDSIEIPGPVLVLERGQPVRITVVNHLSEATAVHWHGIELESYPDGVPGWSGIPPRVMPPIAPGDSFVAEFTPPRSGTFIYHAHAHEVVQLAQGMYGALIVVEPGHRLDAVTDRIVLVAPDGPSRDSVGGWVNGRLEPRPLDLEAGRRYRLRLINIHADNRVLFALGRDSAPGTWRPVAKDGADLPPALSVPRSARLLTGPGETADFELAFPQPDTLALSVSAPFTTKPWTVTIPVRIAAPVLQH